MIDPSICKAFWTVTAGVIPGSPIDQYSKSWFYTAKDYERDMNVPPEEPTKFDNIVSAVALYANGLTNPAFVNWVHTEFTWL